MSVDDRAATHLLQELGFTLARAGDGLRGEAAIVPHMWTPGTSNLRTSILAIWTDIASGHLAVEVLAPRVPVTLELDVHVHVRDEHRPVTHVHAASRVVKHGRSVVVCAVDFTDQDGAPLAVATASFMAAPDPGMTFEPGEVDPEAMPASHRPLEMPLARRAGCEVREPGVVVLPRAPDGLNATGAINGGLIALAIEEAALSLTPGASLSSLALRYLRSVRTGPAVAVADVHHGLGRVEVRDAGDGDRLAAVATTRTITAHETTAHAAPRHASLRTK